MGKRRSKARRAKSPRRSYKNPASIPLHRPPRVEQERVGRAIKTLLESKDLFVYGSPAPELVDLDLPVKEILNRRKRRQRDLIEAPSHAILVDGSGTIFPAPDDVKAQLAKELGKELIEVVRQRHPELERPTEPQRRGRRPNPHPTPAEVRAYLRTLGASVSKAAKHFDLSHREIRRRRDRP